MPEKTDAQGQSVNAYINTAIDEKMSREAVESPTTPIELGEVLCLPKLSKPLLRLLRAVQKVLRRRKRKNELV